MQVSDNGPLFDTLHWIADAVMLAFSGLVGLIWRGHMKDHGVIDERLKRFEDQQMANIARMDRIDEIGRLVERMDAEVLRLRNAVHPMASTVFALDKNVEGLLDVPQELARLSGQLDFLSRQLSPKP